MVDFPTLASFEELLEAAAEFAVRGECKLAADAIREAAQLCEPGRTVQAPVHIQPQGALASMRTGHPGDAAQYIERAVAIGQRRLVSTLTTEATGSRKRAAGRSRSARYPASRSGERLRDHSSDPARSSRTSPPWRK